MALTYWRDTRNNRNCLSIENGLGNEDDSAFQIDPAALYDLEGEVITKLLEQQLNGMLREKMTKEHAEICRMRQEGFTHPEIAAYLNISENASKQRMESIQKKALKIFDLLPRNEL